MPTGYLIFLVFAKYFVIDCSEIIHNTWIYKEIRIELNMSSKTYKGFWSFGENSSCNFKILKIKFSLLKSCKRVHFGFWWIY